MARDMVPRTRLEVTIGQCSRAGLKPLNQDFYGALIPDGAERAIKGIALAVADGISSSPLSGAAAETTVKALMTDYYATPDGWTVETAGRKVIAATNAWLHGLNGSVGDLNAGHVCTLSALILKGRAGHVFHLGDSRVSRLVGDSLEPLTRDHRVTLSARESYLARGMGLAPQAEIDHRQVALRVGDIFVLTTDGVHEYLGGAALRAAIAQSADLDAAAQRIVDAALANGSHDNLTVQLVRIEALPDPGDPGPELDDLPLPPLPAPGDRIDGYRVVRALAHSARSHVFLARDAQDRPVALKIPTAEMASDPAYLRRFLLEEWVARRVASPHVVAAPQATGRCALYAVTEFVAGVSLRQWMHDHPTPDLSDVRDIAGQIVKGLRALHRRGVTHQDLRPENVMIDPEGTVTLIDLGSVAVAGVEEGMPGVLGAVPGTFQYTAPEYFIGEALSWRADQYALGAILYEMLAGALPYGTQVARLHRPSDLRRLRYRSLRTHRMDLPVWIDAALARALSPDPRRRYNALSELEADLRRPGDTYAATRHLPLSQRDPLRFWQAVSGALAVLCAALLLRLLG